MSDTRKPPNPYDAPVHQTLSPKSKASLHRLALYATFLAWCMILYSYFSVWPVASYAESVRRTNQQFGRQIHRANTYAIRTTAAAGTLLALIGIGFGNTKTRIAAVVIAFFGVRWCYSVLELRQIFDLLALLVTIGFS